MSGNPFLTDRRYWDDNFAGFVPRVVEKVGYSDIFERYLSADPGRTALEIGCGGGEYLCYLAKRFGYRPFGLDSSAVGLEQARATFAANGLAAPELFESDLFEWRTDLRFDLVCSFGFVEHFGNFAEVVARHAELVAPEGMLIFGMPHMAHLNHLFRWLVDRDTLKYHNLSVMNRRAIRSAMRPLPFTVLHLDYYRTFAFPPPRPGLSLWQKAAYQVIYRTGRRVRKTIGTNRPNFLISPKLICVARRERV